MRIRPWQFVAILLAVCLLSIGALEYRRRQRDTSTEALLRRFPSDSVKLVVDVQALRQAGLLEMLAGSRAAEETEYKRFVATTGFDYREHLDVILAAFRNSERIFLLRGRFQWPLIRDYAVSAGGTCRNGYCQTRLDNGELFVSVFQIMPGVLSLAISKDPSAAYIPTGSNPPDPDNLHPDAPVWLSVPESVIKEPSNLPDGTRAFVSAIQGARQATLALGATGNGFEATLGVVCRSPQDAQRAATELAQLTEKLRRFIERENQKPNPRDLSGVLTSGAFRSEQSRVHGRWPIERGFLEAISEGSF
ncbi:MAG: hypothetical protein FJW20_19050 [Acidimicrobiia bacterium]|nr:hypothetical protein [Acidimicrobiia bacterium]